MQEILAVAEMDASTKTKAPMTELSVEDLMIESAMNSVGVSSDKSEEAKQELDEYIAIMLEKEKEDAFEAVRYAIYNVVPQVMTYREAILEETADQFNAVNELNNDMLDMQGKFAAAGDQEYVLNGKSEGVESAYAYFQKVGMNAEKVKQMMADGIIPNGIGNAMLENLNEISNSTYTMLYHDGVENPNADPRDLKYGQATGLFNGLVGTKIMAYADDQASGGYYTQPQAPATEDNFAGDRSRAYRYDNAHAPYASQLNDNNNAIAISLNGYSKEVEAEFKFKIEEYGQYLSLSTQMYDTGAKGNQVHVKDQRV